LQRRNMGGDNPQGGKVGEERKSARAGVGNGIMEGFEQELGERKTLFQIPKKITE